MALLMAVSATAVHAGSARIELQMPGGVIGEAEYWPGEADKPAVLILHGFLQTREFATVRRLAESLADEGYSVLTPTLTLGLSRRRQSLACEAIHTHSIQQDLSELRAWTAWLEARAGKPPVLIGHSTGSIQLAALLDEHRDVPVERAIFISLSHFGGDGGPEPAAELWARAERQAASGDQAMHSYPLNYCRRYVTTAANLLSYLAWGKERLQSMLRDAAAPITLIYGDHDDRIDQQWLASLEAGGVVLRPIAGAGHFFDLAYEFDLLDEVVSALAGGGHG
jgi:pimeloyl-ACP methyl ester carboxylesterase